MKFRERHYYGHHDTRSKHSDDAVSQNRAFDCDERARLAPIVAGGRHPQSARAIRSVSSGSTLSIDQLAGTSPPLHSDFWIDSATDFIIESCLRHALTLHAYTIEYLEL
ncbi:hypothetical protein EVAR_48482_1 [Eumeta japonica]|uniref:Uncharacterized protein n=1 Tax=Eumeta variegata TaxID=151549 RepID=A0A4C1XJ30_EUMVA|nr:hypothetical protein EVAR_48482_1 [Eumeta japonica]